MVASKETALGQFTNARIDPVGDDHDLVIWEDDGVHVTNLVSLGPDEVRALVSFLKQHGLAPGGNSNKRSESE